MCSDFELLYFAVAYRGGGGPKHPLGGVQIWVLGLGFCLSRRASKIGYRLDVFLLVTKNLLIYRWDNYRGRQTLGEDIFLLVKIFWWCWVGAYKSDFAPGISHSLHTTNTSTLMPYSAWCGLAIFPCTNITYRYTKLVNVSR